MSTEALAEKIGALTASVDALKADVADMKVKVDELSKIRGAAGLLLAGAGILVTLGAGVAEIFRAFFRHD